MKKRILSLLLACVVLAGWGAQGAFAASGPAVPETAAVVSLDPAAYESGEALVWYGDGSFETAAVEEDTLADDLQALASRDGAVLVQPNYVYESTAATVNDPLFPRQWALENDGTLQNTANHTAAVAGIDLDAARAWELYGEGKRDVIVALIDTGVDVTHPDLADSIWTNPREIPGNGIDDDNNGYVDDVHGWNFCYQSSQVYCGTEDSHGTHAAGTIAASSDNGIGVAGIVPGGRVKLMVLKVLGGTGSGTTSDVVRAIRYAEANGASVCNLSLGGAVYDPALYQAMASSSMLFVVAAGNDGRNTEATPTYPASYDLDNLIAVANVSYDGTLSSTSNYGAVSVDLGAPGSYILSTTAGGSYGYMSGTSMAAPMVTGAAALLYSYDDSLSLSDVRAILLASASPLDSLAGKTATGGMLNLAAALSFDKSQLPSGGSSAVPSGSSAPQIAVERISRDGLSYLQVRVTDPDGDLTALSYAAGTLFTSQFAAGSLGTPFSLRSDGTALFLILGGGTTYTFYARDAAGNESVVFAEL